MGLLYLGKAEAEVLSIALNASKLSEYTTAQREIVAKVGRRLAGYLADGCTYQDKAKPKTKKLIGFAKSRAEDTDPIIQQMRTEMAATLKADP